jgi:hypothetical protein
MKDTIVSKAEFAKQLDCPRSRITQLSAEGMLVRPDGKVDRLAALHWICKFRSGFGGGWEGSIRGKPSIRERAKRLLEADGAPLPSVPETESEPDAPEVKVDHGARAVFESLIAASPRVPEILAELGVRDPVTLAVSADLFCDLVFVLAGAQSDAAYDWLGADDRSPTPAVNLRALAKRYGFKFDPAAVQIDFKKGRERSAAEQLIEKSDGLLFRLPKAGKATRRAKR